MIAFGIAGWSGSGKTTLLTRLLPVLLAQGVSVSTIKHAHHGFDIDRPGKDSFRHREAGAREVLVASSRRWALMHELREAAEPGLDDLLAHLGPVDLVLVEGFKQATFAKLEVYRPELGKPLLAPDDRHIVALVAETPLPAMALPQFRPQNTAGIAGFILRHCALVPATAEPPAR